MSISLPQEKQKAEEWARELLEGRAVIVDFETTGLRNAEIVQIGVINMQGEVLLDTLVQPTGRIPPDATRIHGITNAMVAGAPSFNDIYIHLSTLLAGQVAVAYNSAYDEGVLKGVCRRRKLPSPRPLRWSCAMNAYARYWGKWNAHQRSFTWQKLTTACMQQKIMISDAHNAIGDCQMTLALIRAMARSHDV